MRRIWRKGDDADDLGHDECGGHTPSRLIDEQEGISPRRHGSSDTRMQVHPVGIAEGQDELSPIAKSGGRALRRCGDMVRLSFGAYGRFPHLVLRHIIFF